MNNEDYEPSPCLIRTARIAEFLAEALGGREIDYWFTARRLKTWADAERFVANELIQRAKDTDTDA